ncbi:MAG: hypothetical protein AB1454_03540 [Candidatus Auribacterota bacterium]|jgi:hypothetical protein|uniref:Uncharacterized protein n=1 Tax=Candidatus Auribacter fodinae TaxID=2093366 RepID=A0A3A4QVL2_9BACT|nr:MAG: hypothetical protein C4541_12605 [Candidatus Auribacter fodinae]
MKTITERELKEFFSQLNEFEMELMLKEKQDLFLDMYNSWLQSNDTNLKGKINQLAEELMQLDPTFKFKFLM